MKRLILSAFLVTTLWTVSPAYSQISIGIRIGPPPETRVVRVIPRSPASGYVWIPGYWAPEGRHYRWHDGFWTLPPYGDAYWVAPRYDGRLYFGGYWERNRNHKNDHNKHEDRSHDNGRHGRH